MMGRAMILRRAVATIAAMLVACVAGQALAKSRAPGWLGIEVETLSDASAKRAGVAVPFGALVVSVDPASPFAAALEAGDVIIAANGKPVAAAADVAALEAGAKAGTPVAIVAMRRDTPVKASAALIEKPVPVAKAAAFAGVGEPLLRIDGGGHQGVIKGIAFTPDGRRLVSAGEDKVIRVWDRETGQTMRTIRGESAPGNAGKIYAMALSRDGKWLAVGGWTHPECAGRCGDIRLYDFASGELKALLKGHTNVVYGLAFSPDGARLISGSGDLTAMIWDIAARVDGGARPPKDLRLKGHTDRIYAVGFTPDGARAVTGSDDTTLRLWRAGDGAEIAAMTGHADKVFSLAVAPDGTIASGDVSGDIRLWDGRTGKYLRGFRQDSGVGSLSFSANGKFLLSTCGNGPPCGGEPQIIWDSATGRRVAQPKLHDNIVLATAFSPDGRWAATGGGNNKEIHLWDPATGARRLSLDPEAEGKPLRLSGQGQTVWAVGFSADGRRIGWGNSGGWDNSMDRGPLEQALTLPLGDGTLGAPAPLASADAGAFRRAVARLGAWSLAHRKGGAYGYDAILDIREGERVVATIERGPTNGLDHRAYTFSPDGETIISGGGNGVLTAYDRAGQKLGEFIGHEGDVYAVAASPDGRFLVSGSADQTVRLWNLKTHELIVTLFRGTDGAWVLYTPQGFYKASDGGAKFLTWQVNKGPEHAACAVTGEQLYKRMNRPALVARAIQLASAEAAIAAERDVKDFTLSTILTDCAPALRPLPLEDGGLDEGREITGGRVTLAFALEPNTLPVTSIDILVNGNKVQARPVRPARPVTKDGFEVRAFEIPLATGANEITVVAENQAAKSEALKLNLFHRGDGDLVTGTLHVLAIGVNSYRDAAPYQNLRAAVSDAVTFARTAKSEIGRAFQGVKVTLLANKNALPEGVEWPAIEPTKANIEAALRALEGVAEGDTVVLFLAGHGEQQGDRYFFLPTDVKKTMADGAGAGANLIDWNAIMASLTRTKGKRILFIDTCYSGGAYNTTLAQDVRARQFVAFAATPKASLSGATTSAIENARRGYFTGAATDGMKGKARGADGEPVRVYDLGGYIAREVRKASDARQEAEFYTGLGDIVIVAR